MMSLGGGTDQNGAQISWGLNRFIIRETSHFKKILYMF